MSNEFTYGDIVYNDLCLINSQTMQDSAIKTRPWQDIFATTQLIPLNITEFKLACTYMPIIFSPIGKPMPIALTSFTTGNNSFVTEGQWQTNSYIPAAIRRYPFVLGDANTEGKRPLYIDSTAIKNDHENPLFDTDGNSGKIIKQALQFCKDYDDHLTITENTVDLIDSLDLFKETQLVIKNKDGTESKTRIFKIIDTVKYQNLSDNDIVTLQKHHALWVIHTHIVSMSKTQYIASDVL